MLTKGYIAKEWIAGDVITAPALNAIEEGVQDVVLVNTEDPNKDYNKIWVDPSTSSVEVPTYEEFNNLKDSYFIGNKNKYIKIGDQLCEYTPIEFEQGAFNTTNPSVNNNYYIRSIDYLNGGFYIINPGNKFYWAIMEVTEENTYVRYIAGFESTESNNIYKDEIFYLPVSHTEGNKYRIRIRFAENNKNIIPENNMLEFYTPIESVIKYNGKKYFDTNYLFESGNFTSTNAYIESSYYLKGIDYLEGDVYIYNPNQDIRWSIMEVTNTGEYVGFVKGNNRVDTGNVNEYSYNDKMFYLPISPVGNKYKIKIRYIENNKIIKVWENSIKILCLFTEDNSTIINELNNSSHVYDNINLKEILFNETFFDNEGHRFQAQGFSITPNYYIISMNAVNTASFPNIKDKIVAIFAYDKNTLELAEIENNPNIIAITEEDPIDSNHVNSIAYNSDDNELWIRTINNSIAMVLDANSLQLKSYIQMPLSSGFDYYNKQWCFLQNSNNQYLLIKYNKDRDTQLERSNVYIQGTTQGFCYYNNLGFVPNSSIISTGSGNSITVINTILNKVIAVWFFEGNAEFEDIACDGNIIYVLINRNNGYGIYCGAYNPLNLPTAELRNKQDAIPWNSNILD